MLPPARGMYLEVGGVEPVFAMLHMPPEREQRETAVLLCPPFGWDEVCSYRSRRAWAQQLADSGHPTLRIDLPSAGDSGGYPEDPGRLAAWTKAVATAARWLAETCDLERIAAIGIGLGGMLLYRAAAEGAPIGEAVLWAVPAKGKAFVRELRAFGRMESDRFRPREGEPTALPSGYTGAGGFVLSAETTKALERLDLTQLELPDERLLRVLLLERDGIAVDQDLRDHLESSGRGVSVAEGAGYTAMMAEPQEAIPPLDVFAQAEAWLSASGDVEVVLAGDSGRSSMLVDERGGGSRRRQFAIARENVVKARDTAELRVGNAVIRESTLAIEQPFGRLFGIVAQPSAEPAGELGAVFLNAGAIRRIGPDRMWVEAARRWASRGVPSLRLDLEGLGDSDGDDTRFADVAELYIPQLVDQVLTAMDVLEASGASQRFVLVGLCSGAYWSFHGALRDDRVRAAFMINPRTLFWDASQETIRYLRRGLLQPDSWRMVLRREVPASRVGGVIRRAPASVFRRAVSRLASSGEGDQLDHVLDVMRDGGRRLVFVFSESEPLHDELERQRRLVRNERWPNIRVEAIPGRDHTLRPLYSQQAAHEALDRALERELAREPKR